MSKSWRRELEPLDRTFVGFEEHRLRRWRGEYYAEDLDEEIAKAEALKGWATDLGLCVLQAQQLECALRQLGIASQVVEGRQSQALPAGELLKRLRGVIPDDEYEVVYEAVQIRNRLIHGELVIGVSKRNAERSYEEIGVDAWSHRGDSVVFGRTNSEKEGWRELVGESMEVETLEDWLAALAAATLKIVDLMPGPDNSPK